MTGNAPLFEADLRISPRLLPVLLTVAAIGAGPLAAASVGWARALDASLLLFLVVAVVWVLLYLDESVGRWAVALAMVAAIWVMRVYLGIPGLLMLLAVPTVLAPGLLGSAGALAIAAAETVLIGGLGWQLPEVCAPYEWVLSLTLVWALVISMRALYRPIYDLAGWSWSHFWRAQQLLEEGRDRQVALREALDALGHANRELAAANEKMASLRYIAEEAQRTKAAFVANVSHEFRTPLNMIIGLVDLLTETPEIYGRSLPGELMQDLEIVHRNCDHLSSMINDVLDLSQIEAGRLALHRVYVNLGELIAKALQVVRPLLAKKGLSIESDVSDALPMAYCDPTRIRQVILNLVSNATRFTEKGGISVRARAVDGHLTIYVTDTGPGISPDDAERIFEPFRQAGNALYQQQKGSGLGLSISRQFVELHGGRMWLESEMGVGSTFAFRIPVAPMPDPNVTAARWIAEDWVGRKTGLDVASASYGERMVLCDGTGEIAPLFTRYDDETEYRGALDLTGPIFGLTVCTLVVLTLAIRRFRKQLS